MLAVLLVLLLLPLDLSVRTDTPYRWSYRTTLDDPSTTQESGEKSPTYTGPDQHPGSRVWTSLVASADPTNHSAFLFGGGIATSTYPRMDFWELRIEDFDVSSANHPYWRLVEVDAAQRAYAPNDGGSLSPNYPGARRQHAMGSVMTDRGEAIFVFGGLRNDGTNNFQLGDLWEWNRSTEQWTFHNVGLNGSAYGADVLTSFDAVDFPDDVGSFPAARLKPFSFVVGKDFYIIGGQGLSIDPFFNHRLWKWDTTSFMWSYVVALRPGRGGAPLNPISLGESRAGFVMNGTTICIMLIEEHLQCYDTLVGDGQFYYAIEWPAPPWAGGFPSYEYPVRPGSRIGGHLGLGIHYAFDGKRFLYVDGGAYSYVEGFAALFRLDLVERKWIYTKCPAAWEFDIAELTPEYNGSAENYPGSRVGASATIINGTLFVFSGLATTGAGSWTSKWDLWSLPLLCQGQDPYDVCGGHGVCNDGTSDDGVCQCNEQWSSTESHCNVTTCYGVLSNDTSNVCSGNGTCVDLDKCSCNPGVARWDDDDQGDPDSTNCGEMGCGGWHWNSSEACGIHGRCVGPESCECDAGWTLAPGPICNVTICYGKLPNTSDVCSGNGVCMGPNYCVCEAGIDDPNCYLEPPPGNNGTSPILDPVEDDLFETLGIPLIGVGSGVAVIAVVVVVMIVILCALRSRAKKRRAVMPIELELFPQTEDGADETSVTPNKLQVPAGIFKIKFEDLKMSSKVLGSGGSGAIVRMAEWKGEKVALKMFRLGMETTQDDMDIFVREVEMMESLLFPNIVRFYGAMLHLPSIGMVMELCGDSLNGYLKKWKERTGKSAPLRTKLRLMKEVAAAMDFLHSHDVVHRDLKLDNVLIDSQETAKVMDFGLSRSLTDADKTKTVGIGTSVYMAPEIVRGEDYDHRVDIYSYAILAWIVLSEIYSPYGKQDFVEFRVSNDASYRPEISKIGDVRWLRRLVTKSWSHTPETRPTFKEIIEQINKSLDADQCLIYVHAKGQSEGEAEDVVLKHHSMAALREVATSKWGRGVEILGIFLTLPDGSTEHLLFDDQVAGSIVADSLVTFDLGGDFVPTAGPDAGSVESSAVEDGDAKKKRIMELFWRLDSDSQVDLVQGLGKLEA